MNILRTAACGLVATLLLAACGNATEGMAFKVPANYQSKLNIFGQEMWTTGDTTHPSMIMLVTIPKKFDISKAGDVNFDAMPSSSMKNAKLTEHQKITMCGDQAGFKASAVGTQDASASPDPAASSAKGTKGNDEDVDMVITGWGEKTYMAMYMHPHGSAPDTAAEAALMTLCPAAS